MNGLASRGGKSLSIDHRTISARRVVSVVALLLLGGCGGSGPRPTYGTTDRGADRDADGAADVDDACPADPEDGLPPKANDGCPAADPDQDGIMAGDDK